MVKCLDRRNTFSKKWDIPNGSDDMLGLWIADMDFQCPPCILEAISNFNQFGIFGYYDVKESYYDSFIKWQKENHSSEVKREWINFSPGIVPAFYWIIQEFTQEKDAVMLSAPVYHPFFEAIEKNDRKLVVNELILEDGNYRMDFEDFESKIVQNHVKLYIFCNPHNPVGKVWEEDVVRRMVEICKKHKVLIISDEIHQDFTFNGHTHISMIRFQEMYQDIFVLTSTGKSFNMATLKNGFVVIPDKKNFDRYTEKLEKVRIEAGNILGYLATEAAYNFGKPWLEEVKKRIYENYLYIKNELKNYSEEIFVGELEGTYLAWLKIKKGIEAEGVSRFLRTKCKIAVNDGEWFGGDKYKGYFRINLATSKEVIAEFVCRLTDNMDKIREGSDA